MTYEVSIAGKIHRVELVRSGPEWFCSLDGRAFPLEVTATQDGVLSILVEGKSYEAKLENNASENNVIVAGERFAAVVRDPRSFRSRRSSGGAAEGVKKILAPMPGKVIRILAPAGTPVESGQGVVVIEAMKMQNEMKSPKKGMVKRINAAEGAAVEAGQVLAEIE
jgi:biotin carboxyl carrier protein